MSHDLTRLIVPQRLDATAGTDRLAHQAESDGAGSAEVTKLRIEGRFENRPDLRLGPRQSTETPDHIAGMFAGQHAPQRVRCVIPSPERCRQRRFPRSRAGSRRTCSVR